MVKAIWSGTANTCGPLVRQSIDNGYPVSTVRRTYSSAPRSMEKDTDEDTAKPMFLPYVREVSEKLEKVCAPLGVKTIFRPQKTLRSIVMRVKQKTPMEKKRNVVYEVPCHDRQLTYIGETRRTMKKRMTEQKYAVKTGDSKNRIAVLHRSPNILLTGRERSSKPLPLDTGTGGPWRPFTSGRRESP